MAADPQEREAWFEWDEKCAMSDRRETWIADQVAHYWKTATSDDLKIAFSEDCEDSTAITKALASEDDAEVGRLCRKAIDAYFNSNAEIDFEVKQS